MSTKVEANSGMVERYDVQFCRAGHPEHWFSYATYATKKQADTVVSNRREDDPEGMAEWRVKPYSVRVEVA